MGDTNVLKPGKFVCPPNFERVEGRSVLYSEDLEDDENELWIIQAPVGVDMSKLENHPINLQGCTCLSLDDKSTPNVQCFASEYSNLNESNFHLIVPRKSDKELHCVSKPFKGHLLITENVVIPKIEMPSAHNFNNEMEESENSDPNNCIGKNVELDNVKKKKDKKRGKNAALGIDEIPSGLEENTLPPWRTVFGNDIDGLAESMESVENEDIRAATKKHKKKSKKQDQLESAMDCLELDISEIKTEVDDTVVAVSEEKKKDKKKKHKKETKKHKEIPEVVEVKEEVETETERNDPIESENLNVGKTVKKKKKKKHDDD